MTYTDATLIELSRKGHEPTSADIARVTEALETRLQVALSASLQSPPAVQQAPYSAARHLGSFVRGSSSVLKLVAGTLFIGAIGGGLVISRPRRQTTMDDRPQLGASHLEASGAPIDEGRPLPEVAEATAPESPSSPTDSTLRPLSPRARVSGKVAQKKVPAAVQAEAGRTTFLATSSAVVEERAAAVQPSGLEAETRLLRQGMALLRDERVASALNVFEQHQRAFPSGLLAEEREVHIVLALCRLNRMDAARLRARLFAETYPKSLLRPRIDSACDLREPSARGRL